MEAGRLSPRIFLQLPTLAMVMRLKVIAAVCVVVGAAVVALVAMTIPAQNRVHFTVEHTCVPGVT
jgi:hypothetical protein